MNIYLLAIGTSMPVWVEQGFQEYSKRLPKDYALHLIEVPAQKRTPTSDLARLTQKEGDELLEKIPKHSKVIALDVKGHTWDTPTLAQKLERWHDDSFDISLLIGGPEGLSPACLEKAEIKWSLSALTFPHPLVRIILAEQIYRAWSIIQKHPYHR